MKQQFTIALCVFLSLLFFEACGRKKVVYPRSETVFVGGGLWKSPNNWNPVTPWAATVGTPGLVYEYLFTYDPVADKMKPWLAESGKWLSDNTYELTLRKNIQWTDGTRFTADDVKFTYELSRKYKEVDYSPIWKWLDTIMQVDKHTLKFIFSDPRYHEWERELYNRIVIPNHIFSKKTKEEILAGANKNPVGTGSYLTETYDQDRMVYLKNDEWWGIKQLGLNPAPKRIVYLRASGNHVAIGMLMKGELDLSNYFLPGVPTLKRTYDLHTWHDKAPYMPSDNTVFLAINNSKKPLSDSKLRRAMAFAINSKMIVERVFEEMVMASNPVGILPVKSWEKYYDSSIEKQHGFSYNPRKAKELLDKAGYRDKNGDGMRETPEGKAMAFSIIVPNGWTDWMESIKVIAKNLEAVGIQCEPKFPDFKLYQTKRGNGDYDLLISNEFTAVSATPYTYFHVLFRDIVGEIANRGNFERYTNPQMKKLLNQMNRLPLDKEAEIKKVVTEISKLLLQDMPVIPLWYNGLWFQASTKHWENWPNEERPYAYPCIWPDRFQFGAVDVFSQIRPKKLR